MQSSSFSLAIGSGLKRILAIALVFTVSLCGISAQALSMQDAKSQQSSLKAEEEKKKKDIESLQENISDKGQYAAQLEVEIKELEKEIDTANRSIVTLSRAFSDNSENVSDEDLKLMEAAKQNLETEKGNVEFRLTQLRALYEEAKGLITTADQAKKDAEAEAKRIEQERKKTDAAIDEWYKKYKEAQQTAGISSDNLDGDVLVGKGEFQWPLPGYTGISQYFVGDHRGIDIAGDGVYGKSIVAAASGEVIYAGWMGTYGYVVFIDHGNGYSTRYAHMSALGSQVGDQVSGGQVIGYVGSTGNSTGPHLHFEVLYGDVIRNPFDYF